LRVSVGSGTRMRRFRGGLSGLAQILIVVKAQVGGAKDPGKRETELFEGHGPSFARGWYV